MSLSDLMPRWAVIRFGILGAALAWGQSSPGDQQGEYVIKAKLIKIAMEYVAWPGGTGTTPAGTREVAVLGTGPLGDEVTRIIGAGGGSVPLRVVHLTRLPANFRHQVLIIQESEAANLTAILMAMRGRSVLTIGDTPGFADQGVMLNLLRESGRVKLEANPGAARAVSLEISSALLLKSRVVGRPS